MQSRRIEGEWRPFAFYESEAATPTQRAEAFQLHHTLPPQSFVMRSFTLVQIRPGEVLALRDHTFTHYKASGKTSRQVEGIDAYRGVIRDEFGLANVPCRRGAGGVGRVTGATI